MRIALVGGMPSRQGIGVIFKNGDVFHPQDMLSKGLTNFDVICIGGAGDSGGGWVNNTPGAGYYARALGGAGGGGGLMRVQGLLSALPTSCPVVVGAGGTKGLNGNHPGVVGYATDGGYSSFNGDTCQASGGKGGLSADYATTMGVFYDFYWYCSGANGGEGGIGGRTAAGGGGAGSEPGSVGNGYPPNHYFQIKDGEDGSWDGTIGGGGGGGAGGVAHFPGDFTNGPVLQNPSIGGRGSYDVGDDSVAGIPDSISVDSEWTGQLIVPGGAGGGNSEPLLLLPTQAGMSHGESQDGDGGAVILLATADS